MEILESFRFGNGITISRVILMKEDARVILEKKNVENNRKIKPKPVQEFVRSMNSGKWAQNGDMIRFDQDDRLIDGQHRLTAFLKSDLEELELFFATVSGDVMITIDVGSVRTVSDAARVMGLPDPSTTSAAAKVRFNLQRTGLLVAPGGVRFSHSEIIDEIEGEELYARYLNFAYKTYNSNNRILRREVLGLVVHLIRDKGHDPEKVEEFFNQFSEELPACRVIRNLRKRLSKKEGTNKLSTMARQIFIAKAWNAFITGNGDEYSDKYLVYNEIRDKNVIFN